jgi:acetate kinase
MKVLVLNSGSSSIKFQLFRHDGWAALAAGTATRIGEGRGELQASWLGPGGERASCRRPLSVATHREGLATVVALLRENRLLDDPAELAAVGHRVVHGGESFREPTLLDEGVIAAIRDMIPLAPLHNPANLAGIEVARGLFPDTPQVAVFDTAFHQTMPAAAYRYALPEYLYRDHRVRRYGFHGTSHAYVSRRAAELLGRPGEDCNLITLHLGSGASAAAVRGGRCVETSMGLTPLEGLVMGTRCGDIDPATHFYLADNLGLDNAALDELFNRKSGLTGLCGANDMREIHRCADSGDARAQLAIDVFCHRLKKYLGAYYATLGRLDAVVFTGGIGENDARVRAQTCANLEALGLRLDADANAADDATERFVSAPDSPVAILVIPTDEELEIARQALQAVRPT